LKARRANPTTSQLESVQTAQTFNAGQASRAFLVNLAAAQIESGQPRQVWRSGQSCRPAVTQRIGAQIKHAEFREPGAFGEIADATGGVEKVDPANRSGLEQRFGPFQETIRIYLRFFDKSTTELAIFRFKAQRPAPVWRVPSKQMFLLHSKRKEARVICRHVGCCALDSDEIGARIAPLLQPIGVDQPERFIVRIIQQCSEKIVFLIHASITI
jgi:hypothetical protein